MSEFENLNNQTPTESDQSFAVSEESIGEPAKTPLASDSVCDNQVYNPTQSLYNLNQSPYRSRKKTNLGVIIAVVQTDNIHNKLPLILLSAFFVFRQDHSLAAKRAAPWATAPPGQ